MSRNAQDKDPTALLYARKCGGSCHRLFKPEEYTGDRWVVILDEMSKLVKLSEEEAGRIKTYLLRNSAE